MANHNQSSIPELPRRRGEVALEARQRFAAELQEAFTAAVAVLSRIPDAHYIPPAAEQPRQVAQPQPAVVAEVPRQPQQSMADRLRQTVPFNPAHTETATAHVDNSQVSSTEMGTHNAEYIDYLAKEEEPDARLLQEQAKNEALDQVIAAYRNEAGLPPQAESPVTAELNMTPLERAEREFPSNDRYLVGDIDVSMGELRDAVSGAYDQQPEEQQS